VRIHALVVVAVVLGVGCSQPETVVRLMVRLGSAPAPQKLRATIYNDKGTPSATETIAPVALPGTIVLHNLNPSLAELCVELEGLATDGTVTSHGAVNIGILAHMTVNAAVDLGSTNMLRCSALVDGGVRDMPGPGDGGSMPAADLAGADLAGTTVAVCPVGASFCDDFETGDTRKWDAREFKFDAGAQIDVESAVVRHGLFALHAAASSPNPAGDVAAHSIVIKTLPSLTPPIALRANVFAVQPIDRFGVTLELYDDTTHGFAVESDNSNIWTLTEDQATFPDSDHHTDMVPFNAGQWHCIEVVIDAGGLVSFFVDKHQLLPTFPRHSANAFTTLQVGIGRTVNAVNDVYIDDVAVGPSRLYCP
jgi:hypothetical protein